MKLLRQHTWLRAVARYLIVTGVLDLAWETAQLPLYTIWTTGTLAERAFAVVHCTGGDVLIAGATLLAAHMLIGTRQWPSRPSDGTALATVALGVAYTVFSEWLNTEVKGSWTYSELMPIVPLIGTGLSPLLQWIVVPVLALRAGNPRSPFAWPDASGP
jgi:hypothetical protein